MKPFVFIAISLLIVYNKVYSINEEFGYKTVLQPDGSQIQIRSFSDENGFFQATEEAFVVENHTDGYFYYAMIDENGNQIPSGIRVGRNIDKDIIQSIQRENLKKIDKMAEKNQGAIPNQNKRAKIAQPPPPITAITLHVILVQFTDILGSPVYIRTDFESMLEGENYTISPDGETAFGSMRQYWADISKNRFNLDVIIENGNDASGNLDWVDLPNTKMWYHERSFYNFVNSAIAEANTQQGISITTNDVDKIAIIYAGNMYVVPDPSDPGYNPTFLWGLHPRTNIDGGYYTMSELFGYPPSPPRNQETGNATFSHIGVHCHECGHILGFADNYYPPNDLGEWALMANGGNKSVYRRGDNPAPLSPHNLDYPSLDWLRPVSVTTDLSNEPITYNPSSDNSIYRVQATNNDFFYIENRQTGNDWNRALPPGGLLIWHTREPEHQYSRDQIDLLEADGSNNSTGGSGSAYADAGDPFPGATGTTSITHLITPNASNTRSWSNAPLGIALFNISNSAPTMTFDLLNNYWSGTIQTDEVWSGTVQLVGDLVIPESRTITIEPGTIIEVSSTDSDHNALGLWPDRVELIVEGTLTVNGAEGNEITFKSSDAPISKDAWGGIRIEDSGAASFSFCHIENARRGIEMRQSAVVDWGSSVDEATQIEKCLLGVRGDDIDAGKTIRNIDMEEINSAVFIVNSDQITIENIRATTNASSTDIITINNGEYNTIRQCNIDGGGQYSYYSTGIRLYEAYNPQIYNNHIQHVHTVISGESSTTFSYAIINNNFWGVLSTVYSGVNGGPYSVTSGFQDITTEPVVDDPGVDSGIEGIGSAKLAGIRQTNPVDLGRYGGTEKDVMGDGVPNIVFSYPFEFQSDVNNFSIRAGNWSYDAPNKQYRQTQSSGWAGNYHYQPPSSSAYNIGVDMYFSGSGVEGKLIFAEASMNENYRVDLMAIGYAQVYINGTSYYSPYGTISADTWYHLEARIVNNTISIFLDDNPVPNLQNLSFSTPSNKIFGLGNWSGTGEFDNLYVIDKSDAGGGGGGAQFTDTFDNNNASMYHPVEGTWYASNNLYVCDNLPGSYHTRSYRDNFTPNADYTVETDYVYQQFNTWDEAHLYIRWQDPNNYVGIRTINRSGNWRVEYFQRQNGNWQEGVLTSLGSLSTGQTYQLKITASGSSYQGYVNTGGGYQGPFNFSFGSTVSSGSVALGGNSARIAFDNVAVTTDGGGGGGGGQLLVDDQFNDGSTSGWGVHAGSWSESGGYYSVNNLNGEGTTYYTSPAGAANYTLKTRMQFGGYEGKVLFHEANQWAYWRVDLMANSDIVRVVRDTGNHQFPYPLSTNTWYVVEVEMYNNAVSVWIDGNPCNMNVAISETADGYVGLGSYGPTHSAYFDYFQVYEGRRSAKGVAAPPRPLVFRLAPNHPNPFNAGTVIAYEVPDFGPVRLGVFNVLGQMVRTLVDEVRPPGRYQAVWDGRDDLGQALATGVYFYRLADPEQSTTQKMTLLR